MQLEAFLECVQPARTGTVRQEAARLVLVDGLTIKQACRQTGCNEQNLSNALVAIRAVYRRRQRVFGRETLEGLARQFDEQAEHCVHATAKGILRQFAARIREYEGEV